MSYSLYLNHWIGVWLADQLSKRLNLSHSAHIAAALILSVGIAGAMYAVIDRTVRNHRSKYYRPASGRNLAATGYGLVAAGIAAGSILS
jgi:peptidoglycan/LPS O-acetylase OafA/YrhL